MNQSGQNGIKHLVETLADIFRQESQDKVAILLEQGILPPVAPIGLEVRQMLRTIQLDGEAGLGA